MIGSLIAKGVELLNPESIYIGPELAPDQIEQGVTIHPGTRIRGRETLICRGAEIGKEAPATVENCFVGPEVSLKGGYFKGSVFLKKSSVGSCAHVRDGTILEEEASAAHSAGLKQTILFPFVTLGSLINFCDCLMAGGTSRKNHSEVGSSYVHFNYTPQQDKATPSLIGDVAKGVMLNQPPVFLGGQGGLVGPCRLAYGTVTAAGTINRKDEHRPGRLIFGGAARSGNLPYKGGNEVRNIGRLVTNNLYYIASLHALRHWYVNVRYLFMSENMPEPLFKGLLKTMDGCIRERIRRLEELAVRQTPKFNIKPLEKELGTAEAGAVENPEKKGKFLEQLNRQIAIYGNDDYIRVIQSLGADHAELGSDWLQEIIDSLVEQWRDLFEGLDIR
ncbi:MAG: protein GlmU [Desulfobacteraceae bacterium]|nr:protein GlmU [Desulfobacteraceae bacterium]